MDKWNPRKIPDQGGRTAVVTGANSGIGFETAKVLSEKGCRVVMACRSKKKGEEARDQIKRDFPSADLHVMKLDLADLESVREFVSDFKDFSSGLDLLINNAGIMAIPLRRTSQGFEMQFGVNHLGHFALTGLLFGLLKNTVGSRIVNVSSPAHRFGTIRFHDLHWEKGYRKWKAYGMSKLANILFTYELAERISSLDIDMKVLAAHPGYADSRLIEKGPEMRGRKFLVKSSRVVNRIFAQSASMGALPILYAALDPGAENKGYYGPGGLAGLWGYPVRTWPSGQKIKNNGKIQLWDISENLTGTRFTLDR